MPDSILWTALASLLTDHKMQCLKQDFCVWRVSIEVNDFFNFLVLQDSTTQGTETFEYTMTSFLKKNYHWTESA